MKKIISACLLSFFFVFNGYSQSDFRSGYVINSNQDTTYGLIDYKGNRANAKKCLFRLNTGSAQQEFTPEQLKAYRFIDSKYYVSKEIAIDRVKTTIFLEYLVNGIVDIYYYRDNEGEHYLVEDEAGHLTELRNDRKEVTRDGTVYEVELKEYTGILKYTFRKSPDISARTETVNLTHKSLINITKDYHDAVCKDEECIIYERKPTKTSITFGPVLGMQMIKATPKENMPYNLYYFEDCTFDLAYSINAGLFFKVNIPNFNERFFFHYDATYGSYTLHTKTTTIDDIPYFYNVNDITLKCQNINNTGMFRYEFPFKKINLAVLAGLFFNYAFKEDYVRNLEVQYASGAPYMEQTFNDNPFSKDESGFVAGLGLSGKIMQNREYYIDFKYQRGFGVAPYKNMNYFIFDAGIHIGK